MTVVNALSDFFEITSYRSEEKIAHTLYFEEGIEKKDVTKPNPKGKHGTKVKFRVSQKYMGQEAKIPTEDIKNWLEMLFYLNSDELERKGITCKFTIYDGLTIEETIKYKPRPFFELLDKILPSGIKKKDLSEICTFQCQTTFTEETKVLTENEDGTTSVSTEDMEKQVHMDIAFRYGTAIDLNSTATYNTFCNYTNTIRNGTHLNAFEDAYCRFIQNKVNATIPDTKKDKIKVTWDDIRTNLFCVINLSTNAYVGFVGNAKQEIDCKLLFPHMKDMISEELTKYFDKNTSELNEIIKIVKLNIKARMEAAKAKTISQKEKVDRFKILDMPNYIPCNNTKKGEFKELFLVEGQSAAGSFRNGSDPNSQAAFLFRGVTKNAQKSSLIEVMQNREWRDLVGVLQTGIGPTFNPDKLYFDRINILTDADTDGYNISALMLVFFYLYMRPLIERGKLYKVYPPLYKLNDKEFEYIGNKAEMLNLYMKKINKKFRIKLENSDEYMDKDEFYKFLEDTYDYWDNLVLAAGNSGKIDMYFIEMVTAYITMYGANETNFEEMFNNQKFIKSIMSKIQKTYKEVVVDYSGMFSGPVNGKNVVLKITPRFFKKTMDIIPIYKKYGYKLTVEMNGKEEKTMSIGKFIDLCKRLTPEINLRFKGLGEMSADDIKTTTLDINNRTSVQFTVEDAEREIEIFKMTHGDGTNDKIRRKNMMKNYKIRRDDLDN